MHLHWQFLLLVAEQYDHQFRKPTGSCHRAMRRCSGWGWGSLRVRHKNRRPQGRIEQWICRTFWCLLVRQSTDDIRNSIPFYIFIMHYLRKIIKRVLMFFFYIDLKRKTRKHFIVIFSQYLWDIFNIIETKNNFRKNEKYMLGLVV